MKFSMARLMELNCGDVRGDFGRSSLPDEEDSPPHRTLCQMLEPLPTDVIPWTSAMGSHEFDVRAWQTTHDCMIGNNPLVVAYLESLRPSLNESSVTRSNMVSRQTPKDVLTIVTNVFDKVQSWGRAFVDQLSTILMLSGELQPARTLLLQYIPVSSAIGTGFTQLMVPLYALFYVMQPWTKSVSYTLEGLDFQVSMETRLSCLVGTLDTKA